MNQKKCISVLFFMFAFIACQNSDVQKIYGTWEEIKEPRTELDFNKLDEQGNPTVISVAQKGTFITFTDKTWKEDNGPEMATKYKRMKDGVIAISYNGNDEYAYAKVLDTGVLNFCLRVNPQAILQFKRVK